MNSIKYVNNAGDLEDLFIKVITSPIEDIDDLNLKQNI